MNRVKKLSLLVTACLAMTSSYMPSATAAGNQAGDDEMSSLLPEPTYTLPSDTAFIGPKVSAAIRANQKHSGASSNTSQTADNHTTATDFTNYQPRTVRMIAARGMPIQFVGCLTVIDRKASSGMQLASQCDVQNVQIGRQ